MSSATKNLKEVVLDVRGEECPIPEIKTSKELQKLDSGKLIVLTDHRPAIDVTLPSLCKSLGLKYEIRNKGDYVEFVIYKESAEKVEEAISDRETIVIQTEKDITDKLLDLTFIMSFVPQIKAIERLSNPNTYVLHIKWIIN